MKKGIFLVAVILAAGFIMGCDQIEKIFKSSAPAVTVKHQAATQAAPAAPAQKPQGTVLAKVNDKVITLEELEQNIKNLEALSPEIKINTPEMKKSLLDEMINQELLYQEARSRGIPVRKEIQDLADGYLRGLAVRQLVIDVTENIAVDPQEIEVFYNQYKEQLSEPEERHVREIVVPSEDAAKEINIAILQGQDFATLARDKSVSDSKNKGGDIGFIKKGQLGEDYKKFDEVAFALDAGQISSIFKGPKGFYIIKVEEVKAPKIKPLTEVWDQVKNSLLPLKQQQRIQELVDKLKRDSTVEIKEELLK
ncbi:MAG: peptidyl-prolyl cis-trans isomerase [Candidatus Omnitrophica bacterium]|nr:peptidyl-prolyl cis-trans isomerase [Candidatus Omnitrophota bacterium]MDD5351572.1 peptidyl-prolyl cis-trans isomerase [Candidatus Omnitrophota bacterium]MDD5551007.1 peptidyl-prolyl cis-trans isomerase [Candidatus Omnitrophota bacterium]